MGITDEIVEARKSKGMNQAEVAEKIATILNSNFSTRQYQNIESGSFPKLKRQIMQAVDKVLGISVTDKIYDKKHDKNVQKGTANLNDDVNFDTDSKTEDISILVRANAMMAKAMLVQAEKDLVAENNRTTLISSNAELANKLPGPGSTIESDLAKRTVALEEKQQLIFQTIAMVASGTKYKTLKEAREALSSIIYEGLPKVKEVRKATAARN